MNAQAVMNECVDMAKEILRLKDENRRLVEALKKISESDHQSICESGYSARHVANMALRVNK